MSNLSNTKNHKEDYNKDPVYYCKGCLSLKIRVLDDNNDYCDDCGSTDIGVTDIDSWERMYKERYNKTLITHKNGR